jgi:hypothetical protein
MTTIYRYVVSDLQYEESDEEMVAVSLLLFLFLL